MVTSPSTMETPTMGAPAMGAPAMGAASIPLVVHATHEAGLKVGGIGAVLDGLLSAPGYLNAVQRTILVGPMNADDPTHMERINNPRSGITIRYSSLHGIFDRVGEALRSSLQQVEQTFSIAILYGTRRFGNAEHEIILVDATSPNWQQVDSFKYYLWENYGLDCARYSWSSEFNLYIMIAPPLFAALQAIGAGRGLAPAEKFIIAHEWLGMPVVYAAQLSDPGQWRTIFYAHETATARRIVEENDGHDTRFYNALRKAREWNLNLEAVFGNQDDLFKHPILKSTARCDGLFAVGDLVVDELRFMGGALAHANIDLVYNGVPTGETTILAKLESKWRLQIYCEKLLGYVPDYVFTHVTRLVLSKALWRDLAVMDHLDGMLAAEGKRAVLFVLSTATPGGRRPEWVNTWESQYGWPVGHRDGNGDLIGLETSYFFDGVEPYNQRAQQSKVVFVNQFGWSQGTVGSRMPAEMEFMDIRRGSDLEFGQSIYEPFGIAQVEPLNYGALCCVSNVCGCVGFAARAAGGLQNLPNMVVADYVSLPPDYYLGSPYDALWIDGGVREWLEGQNSVAAARAIAERLPKTKKAMEALIVRGQGIADAMSWNVVARDYLLPALYRLQ
jgi:hypothetical protein